MRSILLHVEDAESLDTPLHAALSLARATNGHVRRSDVHGKDDPVD